MKKLTTILSIVIFTFILFSCKKTGTENQNPQTFYHLKVVAKNSDAVNADLNVYYCESENNDCPGFYDNFQEATYLGTINEIGNSEYTDEGAPCNLDGQYVNSPTLKLPREDKDLTVYIESSDHLYRTSILFSTALIPPTSYSPWTNTQGDVCEVYSVSLDDLIQSVPENYDNQGSVSVNSQNVTLKIYDWGDIDGDIINVVVNDNILISNLEITAIPWIQNVTLNKGANYIGVEAVNVGTGSPPCASPRFEITDNSGTQTFDICAYLNGPSSYIIMVYI